MKYKRKDIVGQEEELEGGVLEILFLLHALDNRKDYHVFIDEDDKMGYLQINVDDAFVQFMDLGGAE